MGVAERDQDVMLNDTAEGMRCLKTSRTRDELVREKLETELMALIAAKELEAYDLRREKEHLERRISEEKSRLAHG